MASSISSDPSLSRYYMNALNERGKEYDDEIKKNRQIRERDVTQAREAYEKDLQKKTEAAESTLRKIKESADEGLNRQREKYQEALDALNKDRYNRFGSQNREELRSFYERAVSDLTKQLELEKERHLKSESAITDKMSDNLERGLTKQQKESEAAQEARSEGFSEAFNQEKKQHQDEIENLKKNYLNEHYIPGGIPKEVYQKEIDAMLDSLKSDREESKRVLEAREREMQDRAEETGRKHENAIHHLNNEQSDKMHDVYENMSDFKKDAELTAERRKEFARRQDSESKQAQKQEIKKLEKDYGTSTDHLKNNSEKREMEIQQKNNSVLKDQQKQFAERVEKLNEASAQRLAHLNETMSSQVDALKKSADDSRKSQEDSTGVLLRKANGEKEKALEQQSKIFKEALSRQRESDKANLDRAEKELRDRRTSARADLIPPGAEESIRRSVIGEYEKALTTETEKDKLRAEDMQQRFSDAHKKTLETYEDKIAKNARQNELDRSLDRYNYENSMAEMEDLNGTRGRSQSAESTRERDSLLREFAQTLEHQKREFDFMADNQRVDSAMRLADVRQQAILENKAIYRKLNNQKEEIIREYDRKLQNVRAESEIKIADLKSQSALNQRNLERQAKQDMEMQAKVYETRIAQLKATGDERERSLTLGFQDQIDKMRHHYELAAKKKS